MLVDFFFQARLPFFQSWSALSFGASKISGKVAEVGWKFTEVASQKVSEVSGAVSEKVIFSLIRRILERSVGKGARACLVWFFRS